MKQAIALGIVDYSVLVFIPDPASTDGSGKTGLNAAALTVSYTRMETDNDVTVTDATSSLNDLAALTTAHTDWGVKEVSSTLAPGLYRLDLADAVLATGIWSAVVYVMITTSAAAASPMEFIAVAYDPLDGVRLGLTALPNAAVSGVGGLLTAPTTANTGLADLKQVKGTAVPAGATAGYVAVDWAVMTGTAATIDLSGTTIAITQKVDVNTIKTNAVVNGGTITFPTNSTLASTTNITAGIITLVGTVTTYAGNTPQTGDTFALANGAAGFVAIKAVDDAIKAKTDSLTFTVAGLADTNIQRVNDVAVTGDGQPGTEWGP